MERLSLTDSRKAELESRWQAVCEPLPGRIPYLNRRPCRIRAAEDGRRFIDLLEARFPGKLSVTEWEKVFEQGQLVREDDQVPVNDPYVRVTAGHRYQRLLPDWVEPDIASDLQVVAEDETLLILDKPSPLPMHEGGRFFKNTLKWLMAQAWPEMNVRYTHRLDAETQGLLICVKGNEARNEVQGQFARNEVGKVYHALVHGQPSWKDRLVETPVPAEGREWGKPLSAATELRVLEQRLGGRALVEARPKTGRTHQIRVHLWQEGHAIVGDRRYLPEHQVGEKEIGVKGDEPLCLLSAKVTFRHPSTQEELTFCSERSL